MTTPRANSDRAGEGVTWVSHAELLALRRQLPRRLAPPLDRLRDARAGTQASVMRGRGMDYVESRAYQPGDDVRRMDWRLTARSGRLHTKVFQEERERTLWLLLDTHDAMRFGTHRRFKSVQAARAAALATWLGAATSMRVGLACFGPCRTTVRPRGGTRGALAVLGAVEAASGASPDDPRGPESMSGALARMARLARGGSQVLLISDGDSLDDGVRAHLVALRRHAHARVLLVNDALESALPPAGRYPMAWRDESRIVDLESASTRARFSQDLGQGARRLRQMTRELALSCRRVGTDDGLLAPVAELLGITLQGRRP